MDSHLSPMEMYCISITTRMSGNGACQDCDEKEIVRFIGFLKKLAAMSHWWAWLLLLFHTFSTLIKYGHIHKLILNLQKKIIWDGVLTSLYVLKYLYTLRTIQWPAVSPFILHIISNTIFHQRKVKQKSHKNIFVASENLIWTNKWK